jgi:RimJ/RimL family protein N-acetyltransferase
MLQKREPVFERPLWGESLQKMPSGLIPARLKLEGFEVALEPLDPSVHCAGLYRASHESDQATKIWTYLPWGPWPNESEFRQFLAGCAASFDKIWYVFRKGDSAEFKGMACYMDIQPTQGAIEIGGIWFAPDMQRTRAATEALFLMLDHAMTNLSYRRMQWRCNALNQKSRDAAIRLGFKYEGTFYNHMIFKGMNRDTAWYSLLDSDWLEVRSIIKGWLSLDNFDNHGKAKSSLSKLTGARLVIPRS